MTLSYLPELNPFFCILLASHQDGELKRKEHHLDVKKGSAFHSDSAIRVSYISLFVWRALFNAIKRLVDPVVCRYLDRVAEKVKNLNSIIKHYCKLPILLPNQPY